MWILAPGHIAQVVRLLGQDDLLHDQGVSPTALLVVAGEEVTIATPIALEVIEYTVCVLYSVHIEYD